MNIEALVRIRKQKKISQIDLARAIGAKTAGSWSRIEAGKAHLRADALPRVAEVLGISLYDLVLVLFFDHKLEQCSNNQTLLKKNVS